MITAQALVPNHNDNNDRKDSKFPRSLSALFLQQEEELDWSDATTTTNSEEQSLSFVFHHLHKQKLKESVLLSEVVERREERGAGGRRTSALLNTIYDTEEDRKSATVATKTKREKGGGYHRCSISLLGAPVRPRQLVPVKVEISGRSKKGISHVDFWIQTTEMPNSPASSPTSSPLLSSAVSSPTRRKRRIGLHHHHHHHRIVRTPEQRLLCSGASSPSASAFPLAPYTDYSGVVLFQMPAFIPASVTSRRHSKNVRIVRNDQNSDDVKNLENAKHYKNGSDMFETELRIYHELVATFHVAAVSEGSAWWRRLLKPAAISPTIRVALPLEVIEAADEEEATQLKDETEAETEVQEMEEKEAEVEEEETEEEEEEDDCKDDSIREEEQRDADMGADRNEGKDKEANRNERVAQTAGDGANQDPPGGSNSRHHEANNAEEEDTEKAKTKRIDDK